MKLWLWWYKIKITNNNRDHMIGKMTIIVNEIVIMVVENKNCKQWSWSHEKMKEN